MIALERMVEHAAREGAPTTYACVDAVAAALPERSRLRAVYEAFQRAPSFVRRRALLNPLAAARFVARDLKCRRAGTGPAWGIVNDGERDLFAARVDSGTWWARSPDGVAKVHPSRVVNAWEIK